MTIWKDKLNAFETYLVVECHLARLTVSAYMSDVRHFYGCYKENELTDAGVIQFLKQLSDHEFTKSSVARKASALRMYFQFLSDTYNIESPKISELFHSNLTMKLPKLVSKNIMDICLNYEFNHSKMPLRNHCMIAFLIYTVMSRAPDGEDKVRGIAEQIHLGAMVFMHREYKMLAAFAAIGDALS